MIAVDEGRSIDLFLYFAIIASAISSIKEPHNHMKVL